MKRFDESSKWTSRGVPFKEATRTSTRAPEAQDLTVPAGFIVLGGAIVALGVLVAELLLCRWGGWDVGAWAALVAVGCGVGYSLRLFDWFKALLWNDLRVLTTTETIVGKDDVAAQVPMVAYEMNLDRNRTVRGELPGPDAAVRAWARAALEGGSLAYDTWNERFGYTVQNGKRVEVYREFRKVLTAGDRPLAVEQGTHSISLTRRGYDLFAQLLRSESVALLDGCVGVSRSVPGPEILEEGE